MSTHRDIESLNRRELLCRTLGSAGALAAGWSPVLASAAAATEGGTRDGINLRLDGSYEVVPLRKDVLTVSLCQSRVRAVDAKNPRPGVRANLSHMIELIEAAQRGGLAPHKDLLFFHEFPLTGYSDRWDRSDALRVAIELPGEETEALGSKAREHECYIVFGSYVRDRDWPNHLLSVTTTIGPDGHIAGRSWKVRNIKGAFGPNFELFTSTVYDNLDRFVEMYGWDAVVPVLRTDLGNFTTTSTQREPELARAAAMKGCEVFLRTATGAFSSIDAQATAYYNGIYSCVVNNAVSPENPGFFPSDEGYGGSVIYDPAGNPVARASADNGEQQIVGRLPIAEFRRRHRQPVVHMDLWRPVFDRYVNPYPPNLFATTLPATPQEAAKYLADKSRWAR